MLVPEWSRSVGPTRGRILWQMVPRTKHRSGKGPAISDILVGSHR